MYNIIVCDVILLMYANSRHQKCLLITSITAPTPSVV